MFRGGFRALPKRQRDELATFIGGSVLSATQRTYSKHWESWREFLAIEADPGNPFLVGVAEEAKSALVGLFLYRRYQAGARGKQACGVTAGIRMRFAQELLSTEFLDAAVIHTARSACQLNPRELRAKRDAAATITSVKLPVCESILIAMRTRLWVEAPWAPSAVPGCLAYIGCVWGFDQTARISEYTTPEGSAEDHCIRVDDLTFILPSGEGVVGSALAAHLTPSPTHRTCWPDVSECRALAASSKGKAVNKPKLIARRSAAEAQFLDDLIRFIVFSRSEPGDELFCIRKEDGTKVTLRARTVRQELKNQCSLQGLPPGLFSSHSLRKGAITHMRAAGVTENDRRDRGGYAAGSQLMFSTYDYATGLGPLAANGLDLAVAPGLTDLIRLIPARREI